MSGWPSFDAWPFAVAGMCCATLPLIIHLLNRRRYRTVAWAAMDFLREAMQRNRRILRIRDLLLLALRTLAILLIGFALARPYFAAGDTEAYDGGQPLHAVLLIDNSLSMGYQSLEGDLLSAAKSRAIQFVERLPGGSKISVVPICGAASDLSAAPFESKSHAVEAIEQIAVVGRQAPVSAATNRARAACQAEPELAKRVVLLTDNQQANWMGAEAGAWSSELPVQLVNLASPRRGNTWVAGIRLQDQLADTETPATVVVQLRHQGVEPREDIQVTLEVDGASVGVQTVSLEAGNSTREVYFEHVFAATLPEQGRPHEAVLRASIPPDRLPADDERFAVAPVVAALPVVFVDMLGRSGERPAEGRVGATRQLRKLLAPSAGDAASLVAVRHLALAELTRDHLADARLCVVAGVGGPGDKVAELLREYVTQGGQLLIAAGGEFDPAAWSAAAWRGGDGVLPAPLTGVVGATPTASGDYSPFYLDFESLRAHRYFQLAGVSANELRELYDEPLFFKAVVADTAAAEAAIAQLSGSSPDQPSGNRTTGGPPNPPAPEDTRDADTGVAGGQADGSPRWVVWPPRIASVQEPQGVRVLARFDLRRLPYLLERRLGEGRTVFASSGVLGQWTTLPHTNAVLIFDRILRDMLESTLAERNFEPQVRLDVPLIDEQRGARVDLTRPDGSVEALTAGFIGGRRLGVALQRPLTPGLYRLAGGGADTAGGSRWTVPVAIAARDDESDLSDADPRSWTDLPAGALTLLGPDEPIRLAGAQIQGQNLWWWLALIVLLLLLLESLILVWGQSAQRPAVAPPSSANSAAPDGAARTSSAAPASDSENPSAAQAGAEAPT